MHTIVFSRSVRSVSQRSTPVSRPSSCRLSRVVLNFWPLGNTNGVVNMAALNVTKSMARAPTPKTRAMTMLPMTTRKRVIVPGSVHVQQRTRNRNHHLRPQIRMHRSGGNEDGHARMLLLLLHL
jgi:hypothetical protein